MAEGFFIEEIKDKNYIKSISQVESFIDEILTYGQYIMGLVDTEKIKDFQMHLYFFWLGSH